MVTPPFYPNSQYAQTTQQDTEVLRSRAIAPDVAAARGTRSISASEAVGYGFRGQHARSGLLIPSHNTAGEVERYQLRPHNPPVGDDGKVRKYLWPVGSRMQLDLPPASRSALRSVDVPIIITESALKGDALQSAIAPGRFCVLAISGVYGWRSDGMPLSDFSDIPWRRKARERITFRRLVYIAFDSDALTNPNVSRARYEFTGFLRRRGARVSWIDVPTAADGSKQGIDDALAAGHTLEDLIGRAAPAPDSMPADVGPVGAASDRVPEVERLRAENAQLQQTNAMLVRLIKNPHVQAKTKSIVVSIYCEAASKQSRGQVEHDGRIRLEARHVANDHRPIPESGQPRAEVNPLDGSKPIVARSTVVGIARQAAELGFLKFEERKTRKQHRNGTWYADTELLIAPAASFSDFLQPMAGYSPIERPPRKRYTLQEPCPHCHEVHSRTRQTICNGCGSLSLFEILPVPPAHDSTLSAADRSAMTKNLMVKTDAAPSPARPSRSSSSTKILMAADERIDPDTGEIVAAPAPAPDLDPAGALWQPLDDDPADPWRSSGAAGDDRWTQSGWRAG